MSLEDGCSSPLPVATLRSKIQHILHCALFFTIIAAFEYTIVYIRQDYEDLDPWTNYGTYYTLIIYLVRYVSLLAFPVILFQFVGLVFYNAFPPKVQHLVSPICAPFICFRTVTRGDFPALVRNNIQLNLECCIKSGLKNFHFEVVTDKKVNLAPHERVREIVVPGEYRTKNGSLFKARALQYCLEDDVNQLADENWIVHLDEETLLTEESVLGILNFVVDGKHQFGQGLITYASDKVIVNWITTVMDFNRVAIDMGIIRCQFKIFHKPIFGWKGSYIVTQASAERSVTFDHGPDGSITEDGFFAMKAYEAGYSFDFIDGHMMEKSPFTLPDHFLQRKRWFQGALLIIYSRDIAVFSKFWYSTSYFVIPFSMANFILSALFPSPCPLAIALIFGFMGAVTIYLCLYGAIKSMSLSPHGKLVCVLCSISAVCMMPFSLALEYVALVFACMGPKHRFYILNKTIASPTKIV